MGAVRVEPGGPFPVGSRVRNIPAVSFTRPADTTAYTAGDVVSNSTTAADCQILRFKMGKPGSGFIQQARVIDSANVATKPDLQLWLFDRPITMDADNAVFTPTDVELERFVAIIAFPTSAFVVGDATSGADGNSVCDAQALWIPFVLDPTCTELFGVAVVRNAYAPVSAEKFTVRLAVLD